jgi:hypothetical protein
MTPGQVRQGAVVEQLSEHRSFAPLLIGITGKLDLRGADAAVRAALDAAFDRLDERCPTTPKVLVSAIARGADTVAAEAALARPNWTVVAPLPFSEALYRQDFDEAGAARLRALLADPRVHAMVIDPLRARIGGKPLTDKDLGRSSKTPNHARTDHYEQAGLFIAERAGILVAIKQAEETPGKIGGTARIVHHRLNGRLDADSVRVVARSDALLEPPRLVDRHTGPVWVVDLTRLKDNPEAPADALLVLNPGHETPTPLGANQATKTSLALADGLEAFNRRIARLGERATATAEASCGPHHGDAASELRRLRRMLSVVQGDVVKRVRSSIRDLAGLSLLAILCFEIYSDLASRDFYFDKTALAWAPLGCLAYVILVIAAVLVYWNAGRRRWQRIGEDYRAAAEALRVQLVWWASGLTGRRDRIEQFYQHGARGSVKLLRTFVNQLVDGCLLRFARPGLDPDAARAWAEEQMRFFDARIDARRDELAIVESASWFLFAVGLGVAAVLPLSQVSAILRPISMAPAGWSAGLRALVLAGAALAIGGLFMSSLQARRSSEDGETDPATPLTAGWVWTAGIAAGVILTLGLCFSAAMVEGGEPLESQMKFAKELVGIAVIMPPAIAGALRFVADKSSWAAELAGYEHARAHFGRGQAALAHAGPLKGAAKGEHREIILALGAEALSENENWLRAHRERPLEPIVGG